MIDNKTLDLTIFSYILAELFEIVDRVTALKDHILRLVLVTAVIAFCVGIAGYAQMSESELLQAVKEGRSDQVIAELKAQIAADESYNQNYYLLGRVYLELGQCQQAADQFQLALDKKKSDYESLYYLSRCNLNLGKLDKAEKDIKEGKKKAKEMIPQFLNAEGLLLMARKDYSAADVDFRKAISESEAMEAKTLNDLENAPHPPEEKARLIEETKAMHRRMRAEFHLNLGDANFYQKYPSIAVEEYDKALKIDTGSTEVYYHWAEACIDLKDYNCAIEKLGVVLKKDSTHAGAWMRAGGIYYKAARSSRSRQERAQRYADAIGSYEKYLALSGAAPDSSNVGVFFELGMAYSSIAGNNVERWQKAIDYFNKVLSIPVEPKDIYFFLGKADFWAHLYDEAATNLIKEMDWASKQDPEEYHSSVGDDELFRLLGDSYFYRKPKDFNNAIKYYLLSLAVDSTQERLLQNVAVAYHSIKSFAQAIHYYEKRIAMGIDSSSASLLKNAGYCALNIANGQGDQEDDELLMEELGEDVSTGAADMSGVDPNLNYYEVAVTYLKHYLDYVPNDAKAVQLVANTYLYQLQDCTNGVTFFERQLALEPNNCSVKKSLGFAYFGGVCTKDYTKALGYLLGAYDCFAASSDGACSDKEIAKWIAQCYHLRAADTKGDASADYKNAWEWYGKALKCNPNDQECKKGQDETRFMF